jgi:hypothetical protein
VELAPVDVAAYVFNVMEPPSDNGEEKVDRVASPDPGTPDAVSEAAKNKSDTIARNKVSGGIGVPRGVYRFKTHEEADAWMTEMLARHSSPKT